MLTRDELLAKAQKPVERSMRLHPLYKGKIQTIPKCPIGSSDDFAIWYTPGVAAPCKAIQSRPELVYEYTNKGNTIAIVSDGTRVLGLGDIGPEAGLPVMEGKALLFKYLGGIDAVPICLKTRDADEIIRTAAILEPSFGGINLEDISQPKCFRILDALRATMGIPVWHDDQQGSATAVLAGLLNALRVVGKRLDDVRIAMIGMGAANVATYRLLKSNGVDPRAVVACDSKGILHRGRADIAERRAEFADKWRVCTETNPRPEEGSVAEALKGADVCIAFSRSGPGVITPDWVRAMNRDAVVFACANPIPEIWPWEAKQAGIRIVATGRSDFPNQVNNSLVFPGLFRGVLDVRARTITDDMAIAAAAALAAAAQDQGLGEERILPTMDEWRVAARVAAATADKAQEVGIAGLRKTRQQVFDDACRSIMEARRATEALMKEGIIPAPPDNGN